MHAKIKSSGARNSGGFIAVAGMVAAAAALLLSTAPAHAAGFNDPDVTSVRVRFADLDLNTNSGTHDLYMRLRGAARSACGDETEIVDLTEYRDIIRCEQTSIEKAVAQIDRPLLTALYDKHYPREPLTPETRVQLLSQVSTAKASSLR